MHSNNIYTTIIPITKGSSAHLAIRVKLRYANSQDYIILVITLIDPATGLKRRGLKAAYYSLKDWNIADVIIDAINTAHSIQDGLQGDF